MVGDRRTPAANEAGLASDELQMHPVTIAQRLAQHNDFFWPPGRLPARGHSVRWSGPSLALQILEPVVKWRRRQFREPFCEGFDAPEAAEAVKKI